MPIYTYRCAAYHLTEIAAPMTNIPHDVTCGECGEPARRIYVMPGVNWGGLAPHQEHAGRPAWLQDRFDNEERNRDNYRAKKAQRSD